MQERKSAFVTYSWKTKVETGEMGQATIQNYFKRNNFPNPNVRIENVLFAFLLFYSYTSVSTET